MRRAVLAIALAMLAAAAGAQHDGASPIHGKRNVSLPLRLADGSIVLVACNNLAEPDGCARGTASNSASMALGPRRAPLRRHAQAFDTQMPGAVASVRG